MRSIHTLFTLLFSAMGICAVAMFTVTLKVADLRQESRQYQNQLYQYYRLSHELKQSSDHLTKFARAYSVTGDPYWVELFNHVLHVRNGQSSIPKGNDYEYWDVVSSESTLFTGHNDLASKPLFDRIRRSGIAPVEFLELKNALMLSDELVLLEREALMAVKGFKKGEDGEFTDLSSPDLEHARSLLYGKKYFSEKAKIMSAIGASHTAIVERIEAQIGVVSKKEARYAMVSSVLVATLLSIIILSFILLWRLYIGPLSQMLKTVVSHVNRQDYAFTLTQKAYAELQQFIDSLNIVFHHIAEQLSHNTLDKDFNIVMRTNQSTQSLCQGVTQFILRQFPIEMVGIYIHRDSELKRISGVGYGDGIITLTQDASSTHMGVLMSGRPYSMKKLQGKYHIELSGGQLEINEIYYLPLWVNDQPVALLEIGTLHELSHQQYQQLTQMLDDLSVSIQLSQNVEMQRAAEQKVMEQSQLNQEILNATPNPMYCLSPNGQYLTVNAKFCDLVELSMPEVLGKTPGEIFDTKAANTFSEAHKALSLKQGNQDYELMLEDQAGKQKTLLVNEASFDNPQGQIDGIVGILLDLTDRKQMEEDLREAKENAVAVSRAKGDFLANMSHEIRTPMNAILGMAHLALDTELDATQRNYISRINQSAKNLLGVIDDILDFSKIEAGKLAVENISFNLNEVLNNLTSVISLKAQDKGMEFLLDIDPEIPAGLMGDPLRLGQVLVNLCGNAVKFTEEGEVMVSCSLVQESGDSVTLRFLVKDTGVGINRDKIDTLFTSFSQADTSITRQFGGTGLGLSISKQLVELMHGELSVESVEGQGSIFSFTIVCGQQEAKIRDRFQPINALAGKRALIVDDNQSARNIMLTLLTTMHFEAKAVSNGFEALDELQNSQFDMIFADWNMPGMNGLELFKKAKDQQLAQQARHFLVTAYGHEIPLENEYGEWVEALIAKPICPSNLLDAIMVSYGFGYLFDSESQVSTVKPWFSRQKVLLVEDNHINQEVAVGLLNNTNLDISIAENGQIAVDMMAGNRFDIVLMDMQMPVMDGVTATQKIRAMDRGESVPIVAMTANAMTGDVSKCIQAGMNDHIAKPINVSNLYRMLRKFLTESAANTHDESVTANNAIDDTPSDYPRLTGIDVKQACCDIGLDTDSYTDILHLFLQDQAKDLELLNDVLNQRDWDTAARMAHTLKGSSANLRVDTIYKLSLAMEDCIDQKVVPGSDLLEKARLEIERLQSELQAWLHESESKDEKE